MNIALWIIAGILAAAMLGAGLTKLIQTQSKVIASGMSWAEDFTPTQIKVIGAVEVLGAVGLILPAALGIATVLTPLAATGLALTMLGATVVHLRRGEAGQLPAPVVFTILAAIIAVLRFGPYSF